MVNVIYKSQIFGKFTTTKSVILIAKITKKNREILEGLPI